MQNRNDNQINQLKNLITIYNDRDHQCLFSLHNSFAIGFVSAHRARNYYHIAHKCEYFVYGPQTTTGRTPTSQHEYKVPLTCVTKGQNHPPQISHALTVAADAAAASSTATHSTLVPRTSA